MSSWYEIKDRGILGGDEGDKQEMVILGRMVRWTPDGIEYEADPKHRELILEFFGFCDKSKRSKYNGLKEDREEIDGDEALPKTEATEFRGVAARANYLSLDCPDLQFPVKECSREMSNPTRSSWAKAKKIARYLVGRKRVVWEYGWQEEMEEALLLVDSDWGGGKDRKSTSGGVWSLGGHCIKTWSASQGAYALSSAEAELYGMVEGVTRAKGLRHLLGSWGFGVWEMRLNLVLTARRRRALSAGEVWGR